MTCPSALDYSNAIQNPQFNFQDSELKAGQPASTPLGLPRPISGNFATVFQLHCPQHDWAVRCFTRELNHQQARYAVIHHHLEGVNLPYMVNFTFLPKGIRIYGRWYPILKMQWLEGQLLHHFLAQHLQQPARLRQLALGWLELIQALEQADIAHGDLQHGNIVMVNNNDIKLVDYDNLFVPALAGQLSRELGHSHYQHPARDQHDFGSHMDRFSAWLIFISIIVLIQAPELWAATAAGDDALLLRQEDMLHLPTSTTFLLLMHHQQILLRLCAEILEKLLTLPVAHIPALTPRLPVLATLVDTQPTSTVRQQLLDYLCTQQSLTLPVNLSPTHTGAPPITPPALPSRLPYPPVSSQAEAQWFQEAARQGYADAQYTLGWMYVQGEGLPQDVIQARYWFGKAAQQGHYQAQYQLGGLYLQGVVSDPVKASYWYVQAALQGHEQARKAQIQLALTAAQQGDIEAQYVLGLMYAQTVTEEFQAVQWWQKAAQQGHKQAQYALARCYEHGEGISANLAKARYWYAQAAKQGHLAAMQAYINQIYYTQRSYWKTVYLTGVTTLIGFNLLLVAWLWQQQLFTWSRWLSLSGWLTLISLVLAVLIAGYRESSS